MSIVCFALICSLQSAAFQRPEVRSLDPEVVETVFAGRVLAPDGTAARGAVVCTSAGGEVVTDRDGFFELAVDVPLAAEFVEVSAVASARKGSGSLSAAIRVAPAALSPTTSIGALMLAPDTGCSAHWVPTFGGYGGTNDVIEALAVYDDGRGPALYAGGKFTRAGEVAASRIARWDGSRWSALGGGLDSPHAGVLVQVAAMTVFDDGSGPALYVGGRFDTAGGATANNIARWDGRSWSALGTGVSGGVSSPIVRALAVFDDGHGPALYAGGAFVSAGGVVAARIAKWNGTSWSALGSGPGHFVEALTVHDDGSGPALVAGGWFTAGAGAGNHVAKWNGTSWSALGSGLDLPVYTLTTFDDGTGPALYAGGTFLGTGSVSTSHVARWDGASWSPLGGGTSFVVKSLAVFDDGSGPRLWAGKTEGGSDSLALWDGTSWSVPGGALHALTGFGGGIVFMPHDDGHGPSLFIAGAFRADAGPRADFIARWDGATYHSLQHGSALNPSAMPLYIPGATPLGGATALMSSDDGGGPALVVGGLSDGNTVDGIGRWDGEAWSAFGSGMTSGGSASHVLALASFDDGSGPALFAGGGFTSAGGVAANRIARWDGTAWSALGSGLDADVRALAVFDDGSGPALYVGGLFALAGGVGVQGIARWDGTAWSGVGGGVGGEVHALAVHDDGTGPALFVGGSFLSAGGFTFRNVGKWDGAQWNDMNGGVTGGEVHVDALASFDDGTGGGPALYLGGLFSQAGERTAWSIARWDGAELFPVGSGLSHLIGPGGAYALEVFDDGAGPMLYVGGSFATAGGIAANSVARWDGSLWSPLGRGVSGVVRSFGAIGDDLYVSGLFDNRRGDRYLARWGCGEKVLRR